MRTANALTFVAVLGWAGMFFLGLDGIKGVIHQHVPGYPNVGQIEFYLVYPAVAVMTLLGGAWAINSLGRWPWVLGLLAMGVFSGLIPFVLAYGGGV